MAATPKITLHYFDARGRAQFLRYYLAARDVEYTDQRVPLSADFAAWAAIRGDRSKFGPFHRLPVLHWGDRKLAETLVIQAFLHRALGDEALLSDEDNLRHSTLVSSLYVDVMLPIGTLIWADVAYVGCDVGLLGKRTLDRLRGLFSMLNTTLDEWGWIESAAERPVVLADCMLWEEIDVVQHVFGARFPLDDYPTLARWHRSAPAHAVFAAIRDRRAAVTGRGLAAEDDVILRIRERMSA
jgi:glutathione S-transferase